MTYLVPRPSWPSGSGFRRRTVWYRVIVFPCSARTVQGFAGSASARGGVENFAHAFTVAWGTPANLLVDPYTSMRERPPYRFRPKHAKIDQIIFIFLVLSLSLIFTVQIWPQNVLDPL